MQIDEHENNLTRATKDERKKLKEND